MDSNIKTFYKDPQGRVDYQIDWTARLENGETLTDVSVDCDRTTLVVEQPPTVDGNVVKFWLREGNVGEKYRIVNRVETSGGRIYDVSVFIIIQEQ